MLCLIASFLFLTSIPRVTGLEAQEKTPLIVGEFSAGPNEKGFPDGWRDLHYRGVRPTDYSLVKLEGVWVMKAESQSSASGFITRLEINPRDFPIIKWRWRVETLIDKSDLTTKAGDDHPARIYVGFEYDRRGYNWREKIFYWILRVFYGRDYPSRAINYIWASHDPVGSIQPNPFTRWVQTVVVQSGNEHLGQWIEVERNVYEDYWEIFRQEPPTISGIGMMTDSDGSKEHTVAYYGDILFKPVK